MKNLFLFVLGLLIMVGLFSCQSSSSPSDAGVAINVDLSNSNEYLPLSVLAKDVHLLRLELPSPYFFGIVNEVLSKDSAYFIVDKKQNMVFRFTKDGTFLNAIGKRGEGPGEYREMSSFFVNDSCAFICDIGARKIYSYSFDGRFLQTMQFPYSLVFDDIAMLPDGRFLCHRPSDAEACKGLWIMDQSGKKVKTLIEYKEGTPYVFSDWNTLYTGVDGSLKAFNPTDGSYYRIDIDNDTVVRTMSLKPTVKMLADLQCSSGEMLNTQKECAYSLFTVDGEHFVLSLWTLEPAGKIAWSICNKEDKSVNVGTLPKMDLSGYSEMGRPVSSNIPNTLVTIYTDEFSRTQFPAVYQDQEINEKIAILCLLEFK